MEKAMAPHSSTLAWKISWTEEPGGPQSMGSLRVGHDWETSLSCIGEGNGNPLQCSCLENPRDGGEPGGLTSVGSHRVGHDWSDLAVAARQTPGVCISKKLLGEANVHPTINLSSKVRKPVKVFPISVWLSFWLDNSLLWGLFRTWNSISDFYPLDDNSFPFFQL